MPKVQNILRNQIKPLDRMGAHLILVEVAPGYTEKQVVVTIISTMSVPDAKEALGA